MFKIIYHSGLESNFRLRHTGDEKTAERSRMKLGDGMKEEGQKAEKADGNMGKRDQTRGQMVTRGKNQKMVVEQIIGWKM